MGQIKEGSAVPLVKNFSKREALLRELIACEAITNVPSTIGSKERAAEGTNAKVSSNTPKEESRLTPKAGMSSITADAPPIRILPCESSAMERMPLVPPARSEAIAPKELIRITLELESTILPSV
jgi:hypothetical protein